MENAVESQSDRHSFVEYLSSDGWKCNSASNMMRFTYQNAYATLSLEYPEKSEGVLYGFEEGEIKSLVKIEPKDKLLELLQIISISKKELSSGQYARHLSAIIDSFPNTYYFKEDKFVLLVNEDIA